MADQVLMLVLERSYKMDNVTFFTDELNGIEHAIIDRGNGEFTSMPKSEYDRQQAEQSTPMISGDE
jgi:hypothetical protein